ncbi:PX domain-containing protein 1-like isoform X2 [Gouania willdenowi]|uniref:PX domain-containing protein 1-like isoform X2 n=1 Tax=Gouania willdenowi TaxID=441366 RepID=UPI0010563701|nr:PX domain-containing protein 1-like isoform X2 [Gouania willdenowi]
MSDQVMSVVEVGAEVFSSSKVLVKVALSDGRTLQLYRSDVDLAQMMKRLVDHFPEDREILSCSLLPGLLAIRAADESSDPEVKVSEFNTLLRTINNLPTKFSQSEAVLAFFEASTVDDITVQEEEKQTIKQEEELQAIVKEELEVLTEEEEEQLRDPEVPIPLSDVLMANGFCLANTESILFDLTPPTQNPTEPTDSTSRRDDGQTGKEAELQTQCSPSLLISHKFLPWMQETDILD